MKRGAVFAAIALLLLCLGCFAWFGWVRGREYEIRFEAVDSGDITATVEAGGKLDAVSVVEVGTQVSGTIKEIYADFNSKVRAGQPLAILDTSVLASQLVEAVASLRVARAGVGSAAASLADAERKLARSRALLGRNLIAQSDFEDAETTAALRRAQLEEARAKVVQAEAAKERAEANLGYARIASPIDGVVVSRQVDVGQTVAAGFQVPTLFRIAGDLTRMRIYADVDESDIGGVSEGQEAEFSVDAFPDRRFHGRVTQVRIAPDATDNVVSYTVVIEVDNSDMRLKPGMTASVSIKTDSRRSVTRVPNAALRFIPTDEVLSAFGLKGAAPAVSDDLHSGVVWLVEDGCLTRGVAVRVGITDGERSELLSGPVAPPDRLAIAAVSTRRRENVLF
ncbi:MAG: efflux RND transporter periplasmic adaptor subunit [Synergistaceae bacterium]|jgi:HlyD family secretion protein|nr:efflux RND transporter periplasmic adaptor subunit [Synergistaceae bacterium]